MTEQKDAQNGSALSKLQNFETLLGAGSLTAVIGLAAYTKMNQDHIYKRLDEIETQLKKIVQMVNGMKEKDEKLSDALKIVREEVTSIGEETKAIDTDLDALGEQIHEHDEEFEFVRPSQEPPIPKKRYGRKNSKKKLTTHQDEDDLLSSINGTH